MSVPSAVFGSYSLTNNLMVELANIILYLHKLIIRVFPTHYPKNSGFARQSHIELNMSV